MAEPSNPHTAEGENPDSQSPAAAEEDEGGGAPGGGLPVLKWTKAQFDHLMTDVQMPQEYGCVYPQEGDTGADALAGYIRMWADFSVRNFEYTFRALGMEPTVGDFRRFYQLTVHTGFFSFGQRHSSPKLMVPPNGITKWKTKFFYIKAAAVAARMTFRSVTETIIAETIGMMVTRMTRKSRPVVREKSGEDATLWRIFSPDFKGMVEVIACAEDEEGLNFIIRENFRVAGEAALAVELPQGKGGGTAAGGSAAGSKPVDEKKKRKVEEKAAGAGERKHPKLRTTRTTAVTQSKPAVVTVARDATADAGVNKEFTKSPSVEVVAEPSVRSEDTGKKTTDQIFDTVDSSDNLIFPGDLENLKFADAGKQKSSVVEKASGFAAGGAGFEEPSIQPSESELEFYYRTYTEDRSVNYHRPP
ncbi:hypothetical protein HanHA89_Chr01g0002821 [Helianthus annuus]|nr:hypothetical protein HanHA89_Chr01g0002821 [Helianthus annuus]